LVEAENRGNLSFVIDYLGSFQETLSAIGERARQLRLLRKLRQDELAARAGVGVATVHRFEKTGTASFENVLRIATALEAEAGFDKLFEAPAYSSLDEALARPAAAKRQRAPRRK
jgi:transcriptional regulator with XRE-family HTH domain